ncbi:uncharacterized protein LOC127430986 isoform X1 [Myxocyprinus asiaticus]|uniref:uncharacterized protein LOC127430986 isoform X1 n=1 Tax=Myxocyprinus asiaticus TaxID=70543 RepID=UPI002223E4F8|nr:uncharacterized protein LOC127430986 isoform X1 [Myxocyprinus asiaticus]
MYQCLCWFRLSSNTQKMKFSSILICGLILSCFCSRATGSKEELSIIQSPANSITVNEGDSAQITCCWNKVNHSVKTVWYKNEKRVAAEKQQHKEDCSILYITKITMNDTGDYFCKLYQDIPYLLEFEGNRTTIIVKEGQVSTYTTTTANVNSVSLSTATAATASFVSRTTTTLIGIHTTTEVFISPKVVPVITSVPAKKSEVADYPKINPEDENYHSLDPPRVQGNSREVVMIYFFRCLPFLSLLAAFFYLNRDDRRVTKSKPAVEHAVGSEDEPEEDLESGNKRRNETEGVEQGENASEGGETRENAEKPYTVEVTEEDEEKHDEGNETVVILDSENESVPTCGNEKGTDSVLDTKERTVSALGDSVVSALCQRQEMN